MASTFSSRLRLELIGTGEQAGTWGVTTNTNLGTLLDSAIAGNVTVPIGSTNQAFSISDGGNDQARQAIITLTSATANFNVYAPPVSKIYIIYNNTNYSATIYNSAVAGGTTTAPGAVGVTIPAGYVVQVWSDGTNFSSTDLVDPVIANSAVVSANSTGTALTVTQTGTGNAFVVQDESPDTTPFVIDNSGRVISGYTTYRAFNYAATPRFQINGTSATSGAITSVISSTTAAESGSVLLGRSRGTQAAPTTLSSGDDVGRVQFEGYNSVAGAMLPAAAIIAQAESTPTLAADMPGRLTFWTTLDGTATLTERMRIDNAGRVGIGGAPLAGPSTSSALVLTRDLENATSSALGMYVNGAVKATTTSVASYYGTGVSTASNSGSAYTIPSLYHFSTAQGTFHADSTVTNQYGFVVSNNLTGATTNVGVYGNLAAGNNATIQSVEANGTTATITTTASHGFKVGQLVEVAAVTNTNLNGVYTVTAITDTAPGPYTFQYARAVTISAIADTGTAFNLSRWFLYNNSSAPSWFAGRAIIDTSSGAPALRVTQRGLGNAILVEDSTNPDSTPFVVNTAGLVAVNHPIANAQTATLTVTGQSGEVFTTRYNGYANWYNRSFDAAGYSTEYFTRATGTIDAPGGVSSGTVLGRKTWQGYNGTAAAYVDGARIDAAVDGTPGAADMPTRLYFSTTSASSSTPTERMRIDSQGRVGIGATPSSGRTLTVFKDITGSTSSTSTLSGGEIQSDVTSFAWMFRSDPSTAAASFTLNTLIHYGIAPTITFGAGSTVTTQYGFASSTGMTGATTNAAFAALDIGGASATTGKTNYGFYSNNATATGGGTAWNFYANGTAPNFFQGSLFAGRATSGTIGGIASRVQVSGTDSGGSGISAARWSADTNPSYLTLGKSRGATIGTVAAVSSGDTIGAIQFAADDGNVSGTFPVAASIVAAVDGAVSTNDMPGRLVFNTTTDGTATLTERMRIDNLGRIGIGSAPDSRSAFNISNSITNAGAGSAYGLLIDSPIKSDATTAAVYVRTSASTSSNSGTAYTVGALYHYLSNQGTLHADSTVTSQYGFATNTNLTGATNNYAFFAPNTGGASATTGKTNYGFRSAIDTATGGGTAWNIYADGTAQNHFAGNILLGGTAARATIAGTRHLSIFNGTEPSGTLTNGITIYAKTGEAYVMDAAGNSTLFSPHDPETNEWIFRSKHTPSGKVLKINVEKMLRFLNDHFGLDMIEEFTEE